MRRLLLLLPLALAVFAAPAVAQTTATTDANASCTTDDSASASAAGSGDGGVPAGFGDGGGSTSGGVPASWDGSDTSTDVVDASSGVGDAMAGGGVATGATDTPGAVVAQEPEPSPEGPGQEQPGEPGGEPQQPSPETPGGEAPGVETGGGGGLPRTGLEALRIGLLGLVLLMVGARLRVLALRRKRRDPMEEWAGESFEPDVEPVAYEWAAEEREEWGFPDPTAPAPTGLLPSTASARRRVRVDEPEPSTVV
jgi:hypothetical protein